MQVYRGMDIGTAKPDADELAELPHHLIDICAPNEQFSAAGFMLKADALCAGIWHRHHLPVIEGGTGFYIRSFLLGLPPTPPADMQIREKLADRLKKEGNAALYDELKKADPESASRIDVHDSFRIVRSLEIFLASGKPRSAFILPDTLRPQYHFCTLILGRGRKDLYSRIDSRVEDMFRNGLVEEYNHLVQSGYTADDPGMQAIGYRELAAAFPFGVQNPAAHTLELTAVKEQIKHDSRRYAKKQYTYMRDIPGAVFCPISEEQTYTEIVLEKISSFYQTLHLT